MFFIVTEINFHSEKGTQGMPLTITQNTIT